MTQDFVEDLIQACEKEGKRCVVVVFEDDFSGGIVTSTGIDEDSEKDVIQAIEAAFL